MLINGIILAAGKSTRFPEYKLIQKINETTVLESCIKTMMPYVDSIVVVTGHEHRRIEALLLPYERVTCVYNPDYETGMFSSIKQGLKHITGDRFFLMPGDQPIVKSSTYETLLTFEGDVIIPSYHYKSGHPILLDEKMREPIICSNRDSLRDVLSLVHKTYANVEDPYILKDIDTKDELNEMIRGLK
ncbi:MAG: nucleotidyltransferase family protein [Clostridia bacterium]|nr:nucleotidyltransferase family protein [Clostridia bacterium]